MHSEVGQMLEHARAFGQTLRVWSNAARFVNWANAQRIWAFWANVLHVCLNAQIGQMRLTLALQKV